MITFLKNLTLTEAILGGISILLLILVVSLAKSCYTAHSELSEANSELARVLVENMGLKDAISVQNASISELSQKSDLAKVKSESELKAAQVKNKQLEKSIDQIKATKVVNCEDTAPILNSVIEALRGGQ